MYSEKDIRKELDKHIKLAEIYENALLEQFSVYNPKDILANATEYRRQIQKIKGNSREDKIYMNGILHGLLKGLYWVLGDNDYIDIYD